MYSDINSINPRLNHQQHIGVKKLHIQLWDKSNPIMVDSFDKRLQHNRERSADIEHLKNTQKN